MLSEWRLPLHCRLLLLDVPICSFERCDLPSWRWVKRGYRSTRLGVRRETGWSCHLGDLQEHLLVPVAGIGGVPLGLDHCLPFAWGVSLCLIAVSSTHLWKVIGFFYRHKLFIIYLLNFILIFTHNICDVVNFEISIFYWILTFGYTSVTFLKGQLGHNPISLYPITYPMGTDNIETHGKLQLVAFSKSRRLIWKYHKLPETCRHSQLH